MANQHIKVINGRKYFYSSIRIGKKVTSKYLGPVDERKRRPKMSKKEMQDGGQPSVVQIQDESADAEDGYIG